MNKEELKARTKKFALAIIKLVQKIPNNLSGKTISGQLIRSATSVAANYRAACRARSNADFISKITVVEEECDESLFWLELIEESDILKNNESTIVLKKEANELTAIFTAIGKTSRLKNQNIKKL
jgi:four helix bundle protein